MSSIATSASLEKPRPRRPRWFRVRRQTRVGIDFEDDGFRLASIAMTAQGSSLDTPRLKLQWQHRISEPAPSLLSGVSDYLETLATRLPRHATRGGVATTIAIPPSAQSLRCVASTQLAEAERSIADELGGDIQCRSWSVGAQKSMVCGVRRDIAEAIIAILCDIGYRCESILPRSIALGRTLISATQSTAPNATILCWGRQRSLVTMIHERTIRLCREFAMPQSIPATAEVDAESPGASQTSQDQMSQAASEIAEELMLTLQHASRLNPQILLGPVVVCGEMSEQPQAFDALRAAARPLFEGEIAPWRLNLDAHDTDSRQQQHELGDAVATSLAVGGSALTMGSLHAGGVNR
ncbi:MAG: hypothetical protein ACO1RT_04975 [Planctomycetaceae bacterium]